MFDNDTTTIVWSVRLITYVILWDNIWTENTSTMIMKVARKRRGSIVIKTGIRSTYTLLTSDELLWKSTEWHSRRQEKNKILKAFYCCKDKSFKRNKNMLRFLLHIFMRLLEVQANMQVVWKTSTWRLFWRALLLLRHKHRYLCHHFVVLFHNCSQNRAKHT